MGITIVAPNGTLVAPSRLLKYSFCSRECTAAAKAAIDLIALTARLEAAPFQIGAQVGVFQQPAKPPKPERKLQLLIAKDKSSPKKFTYSIIESGRVTQTGGGPGPTLVLTRNQPVVIHITNQLDEATSVHWHGIELECYYDGVPGWGGDGPRVTPMIAPGRSFDALFAPPRAGRFTTPT